MQKTALSDSPIGHGTCVASKIAGKRLGTARNIKELVITNIDYDNVIGESWLDGLLKSA